MNLITLAERNPQLANSSVPSWMIGAFRRRSISFSDGLTDIDTRVYWLQSANLTIDLRLPLAIEQEHKDAVDEFINYEGWYAETVWSDDQLSWEGGSSFQLNNRWPEPAELRRIGNCMVEFAPSGAYVEDWRLLNGDDIAPLIGLELVEETLIETGETRSRKGALIINGQWAGLVIDRLDSQNEWRLIEKGHSLQTVYSQSDSHTKEWLLGFETSIARSTVKSTALPEYQIMHSLNKADVEKVIELDGFELDSRAGYVKQTIISSGQTVERLWRIDILLHEYQYENQTPVANDDATQWRDRERQTLERYTQVIR